jgi:tetratricopeptide (TPR) repeat protein
MMRRTYAHLIPASALILASSLIFASSLTAASVSDENFDAAEKALAAKQWDTALGYFESSLSADPDSLRNASEYRLATLQRALEMQPAVKGLAHEGKPESFDREIAFFEKLTKDHPQSANAFLNYGFCYVDKIPAAGTIGQVVLANTSLSLFTKSIDLKSSWIGLYTRGNSYLYWPKIFGHGADAVADLEKAYEIQKKEPKKSLHVRVLIALGDAYWKTDAKDKARVIWKEGLKQFPDSKGLKERMDKDGDDLDDYIATVLDPGKRVDTDLRELWSGQ